MNRGGTLAGKLIAEKAKRRQRFFLFLISVFEQWRALLMEIKANHITWHEGHVNRLVREKLLDQRGCTICVFRVKRIREKRLGLYLRACSCAEE